MTKYSMYDITSINFNLYCMDNIDFNQTCNDIQAGFISEYEDELKARLKELGLTYTSISYYHPKEYNFEGDDLDLNIEIYDNIPLITAIEARRDDIQTQLNKNKSYDGYWSHTCKNVEDVIKNIRNTADLDIIALRVILDIEFDFDIFEYIIFEDEEDFLNGT